MIDMNTPQPTTDDSNWNDIRWEEHDRVNPETAQGEQSTMMQLDYAKWAKANGTWATVSSYHENVKMWYEDVYNVIFIGNYRYEEPIYHTEYNGFEIALGRELLVHTREGHVH